MGTWRSSTATRALLERSVGCGGLPALTAAEEWKVPPLEDNVPRPPAGYIVSFAGFHERGLGVPADDFFRGLVSYWGVELQHLTPNGLLLVSAFVALCEGWLGVAPNWDLFRHLFFIKIQYLSGMGRLPALIGSVMIQLRPGMKQIFPEAKLPSSNTGWRGEWFYLRNDAAHPLPQYTGRTFSKASSRWREGPREHMKTQVLEAVEKIALVRAAGLTTPRIVEEWLARAVVPLRRRVLRFWEMTPDKAPFEGTATAPAMTVDQVERWIGHVTGSACQPGSGPAALPAKSARDLVSSRPLSLFVL